MVVETVILAAACLSLEVLFLIEIKIIMVESKSLFYYDIYFKYPVLFVTLWSNYGLLRTYLANFTTFRLAVLPSQ